MIAIVRTGTVITVGEAFAVDIELCGGNKLQLLDVDATMPAHGHGMNYQSEISLIENDETGSRYRVAGILFHMPGEWQWVLKVKSSDQLQTIKSTITVQ